MGTAIKPIAKILIVEDDPEILELEKYHLEKEGYEVSAFGSTKDVEPSLVGIDLIVMDRKLPGIEGSDFIRYLRDKGIEIPVIFVSSKVKDDDIIEGFINGGDDYIRKPFNIQEFVYRVKSMLKRSQGISQDRIEYKDIIVNIHERKVYIEEKEVGLTKLEYELLLFFLKHKQKILDRDILLHEVWKDDKEVQKRTINVTINRLRKKIDPTGEKVYIVPIHGIGYKLL